LMLPDLVANLIGISHTGLLLRDKFELVGV